MPFLSLLRGIGAGSSYRFYLSELAGVSVVLSSPITRRGLARTSFFAVVPRSQ